jgi:uncharacterized protein YyaL (SSP411 family)
MLYDQAQLLQSSLDAASLSSAPAERAELQAIAIDILSYLERDLQNKEGAFFSAEDADSLPSKDHMVKKGW